VTTLGGRIAEMQALARKQAERQTDTADDQQGEEDLQVALAEITKTTRRRTKHTVGISGRDAECSRTGENGNGPHHGAVRVTRQGAKLAYSVIVLIHFACRHLRGRDGRPEPRQKLRMLNETPAPIVKNEIGRHKR
jgi:hypothetical protein